MNGPQEAVLRITWIGRDSATETKWAAELSEALGRDAVCIVEAAGTKAPENPERAGHLVFIDGAHPRLDEVLAAIDRGGRAIFLVVTDPTQVPEALADGRVDDVLVHPFRALEALSKIRHYHHILQWDELGRMNESFTDALSHLKDDLELAARLQKGRLPKRFDDTKGLRIVSRYLAGARSGGDYFDVAESPGGMGVLLSDSSSYGLSSAVLSVMMRVAMKLSREDARGCYALVRQIQDEIMLTLKVTDHLSLFYGNISFRDYSFRYMNLGTTSAYYAGAGRGFEELPTQGVAIHRNGGPVRGQESVIALEPSSRLVLVSDGFVEAVGGKQVVGTVLDQLREREAKDTLNELVYRVKSQLKGEDAVPAQDCTALVLDADAKLIRLAS